MKTILIPVSQSAPKDKLKACIQLVAKKTTHKLHLLHVITYPMAAGLAEVIAVQSDEVELELRKKEENAFREFAEEMIKDGYQVDISVPLGFFDQEFLDIASKSAPSLILMFTSGSHSVVEDIFGTNTSNIFEKVTAPIFVVNSDAEINPLKKAAVGLALENESLTVLSKLFSFAEDRSMELNFVKIDNNFQLDIINDEAILNELQELYPNKIPNIIHRQAEDVADGLQNYAKESKADLIVLFTTKRNFIEKLFHKSVTKDLVLHAKKPLLIYHY